MLPCEQAINTEASLRSLLISSKSLMQQKANASQSKSSLFFSVQIVSLPAIAAQHAKLHTGEMGTSVVVLSL
jgi:hypothetical protein